MLVTVDLHSLDMWWVYKFLTTKNYEILPQDLYSFPGYPVPFQKCVCTPRLSYILVKQRVIILF